VQHRSIVLHAALRDAATGHRVTPTTFVAPEFRQEEHPVHE